MSDLINVDKRERAEWELFLLTAVLYYANEEGMSLKGIWKLLSENTPKEIRDLLKKYHMEFYTLYLNSLSEDMQMQMIEGLKLRLSFLSPEGDIAK